MPGVLPVLNRQVVEYTIRMALATSCRINRENSFARKNYFYPICPRDIRSPSMPTPWRNTVT
jgi:aspartyl-tRNA(Asn)/glutamyl-tRNA(Gln) amidotransferase subunit B